MARVLVDIDEGLKRELKVKLLRDGVTLKDWMTRSALEYLRTGRAPAAQVAVPATPMAREREIPVGMHPQAGVGRVEAPKPATAPPIVRTPVVRAHEDDYLD